MYTSTMITTGIGGIGGGDGAGHGLFILVGRGAASGIGQTIGRGVSPLPRLLAAGPHSFFINPAADSRGIYSTWPRSQSTRSRADPGPWPSHGVLASYMDVTGVPAASSSSRCRSQMAAYLPRAHAHSVSAQLPTRIHAGAGTYR
jgi:hypothetical protein